MEWVMPQFNYSSYGLFYYIKHHFENRQIILLCGNDSAHRKTTQTVEGLCKGNPKYSTRGHTHTHAPQSKQAYSVRGKNTEI